MKNSIIVALVSLGIVAIARLLMIVETLLFSGTISILFLIVSLLVVIGFIGIIKGYRIAWQWGRMLGLLGAVVFSLIAVGTITQNVERHLILLTCIVSAVQALLLFVMYFALGTVDARKHFNVLCSECGKTKVRAADFLFSKVICPKCNKEWS